MTISWFLSAVAVMKGHALSLNLRYLYSSAFASSFEFSIWTFSMSLLDVFLMSLFSCIVVRASQSCLPWRCNHVPCPAVSSLSTLGISQNLYPVSKFPALFQHTSCVWSTFGFGKKKTIKTSSSLRSAVFVGSLTVFIPCSGVLLLTLNRFLLRRTFWFLVLVWKRLAQSRYLRVRSSASNQLWFLYYRLWIGFCHHILYVLFCRACSVISVLLCTRVEGITLCSGHICPLSFDSYVSTLIYCLFLSRMVVESFY